MKRRLAEVMDSHVVFYAGMMLVSVFLAAISQVMLKKEALKPHQSVTSEYLNPLVICSYAVFLVASFLTMYAYKGIPLSLGPVLEATSYLYVAFFGAVLFGERLGMRKVIALGLIVGGIVVYALFA